MEKEETLVNSVISPKELIESTIYGLKTSSPVELLEMNPELYSEILMVYSSDNKDLISTFKRCFQEKQYDEIKRVAHKLKGNSGNLGIDLIYKLALDIEQAAIKKNDESLIELIEQFDTDMSAVLDSISKLNNLISPIDEPGTIDDKKQDSELIQRQFQEILDNLGKDVAKVDKLMAQIKQNYSSENEKISLLSKLIFNFENDKARELIVEIMDGQL